ncbi:HNH endonuclease signature motif containing protein [Planotetraspora phitsanulokensis]|uniref:HNH endonuclease signature motif containing protein n=1 Tax=Planotetraspora phitsanulokensis TaxID=575192 RepID=UPI001950D9AD|nr:HNH endonuclease signature motif containing protein [Planotetraspora phitsanulokensis]
MAEVVEVVSALALADPPASPSMCLEQTRELLFARDRLTSAISARVGRVHRAGEAKSHGHASTRTWLQGACGTSAGSASQLVKLATELARLPGVRLRFAEGSLSEGQVGAICAATSGLSDEQAEIAEPILVALADRATPAEVAKAGRYLRETLDPGLADKERDADYAGRYLQVRPTGSGGMHGECRLPREAAARLRTWLDAYARPKTDDDERPLRVRNADALIALLESKITTELLVLVNVESLPLDPVGPDAGPAADPGEKKSPGAAHGHGSEAESEGDSGGRPRPESGAGSEPGLGYGPSPGPGPGLDHGHGREPGPAYGPGATSGRGAPGPAGLPGLPGLPGLGWAMPGLLLATGELLSRDDVARLARTSSLVRLVMDADGQVLDLGRTVRLANGAQRRAVFARYATCWVDGCPLPATVCQIDHADNWCDGGATDLRMLGPACQFHNRDRYRRPHWYQRRPEGKDRWAFTRTGPHPAARRPPSTRGATPDVANSTAAGARAPNPP